MWSILENDASALECVLCCSEYNFLYIIIKSNWFTMLIKTSVSILIFWLEICPLMWVGCSIPPNFWTFPGSSVVKNPPANAETLVPSLVCEHPTWRRATGPVRHNCWARALEPKSPSTATEVTTVSSSHRH